MAERDRRGITARIDRTNHVPVPINVIAPPDALSISDGAGKTLYSSAFGRIP